MRGQIKEAASQVTDTETSYSYFCIFIISGVLLTGISLLEKRRKRWSWEHWKRESKFGRNRRDFASFECWSSHYGKEQPFLQVCFYWYWYILHVVVIQQECALVGSRFSPKQPVTRTKNVQVKILYYPMVCWSFISLKIMMQCPIPVAPTVKLRGWLSISQDWVEKCIEKYPTLDGRPIFQRTEAKLLGQNLCQV